MRLLSAIGALLLGAALSHPAEATCTQANIAGTWTATSVSQQSNYVLAWVGCALTINAQGNFKTNNSGCIASNNNHSYAQGQFKLVDASLCSYSGTIQFPIYGTYGVLQIATLSMDHQIVSGIGGGLGQGGAFVFNMVKVK